MGGRKVRFSLDITKSAIEDSIEFVFSSAFFREVRGDFYRGIKWNIFADGGLSYLGRA